VARLGIHHRDDIAGVAGDVTFFEGERPVVAKILGVDQFLLSGYRRKREGSGESPFKFLPSGADRFLAQNPCHRTRLNTDEHYARPFAPRASPRGA